MSQAVLHALSDVKKYYQTPEQKGTSERLEDERRHVFVHDKQTGIEPYKED